MSRLTEIGDSMATYIRRAHEVMPIEKRRNLDAYDREKLVRNLTGAYLAALDWNKERSDVLLNEVRKEMNP